MQLNKQFIISTLKKRSTIVIISTLIITVFGLKDVTVDQVSLAIDSLLAILI